MSGMAWFGLAWLVLLTVPSSIVASPPNILFMMTDQHRGDVLGVAGNSQAKTPNLDRLAQQGVRFRHAYSTTPTCTPARAALLTGQKPWNHGMLGYGAIAPTYPVEMPQTMQDNGYVTHSIGKDHFGWNKTAGEGVSHGYMGTMLYDGLPEANENDDYDQWFSKFDPGVDPMATGLTFNDYRGRAYALPEYYHPTAWVGRHAVSWINSYNSSQPFMLKVSFHRPHSPYDPPKRVMDLFNPEDMPKPCDGEDWDDRFALNFTGPPNPGIWCGNVSWDELKISRQAYYASVAFVDEWIGLILTVLEERKLLENTLILFTADHGDMLGDHYHYRKGYPYESSAHIPMLVRWPESMASNPVTIPRGSVLDEVVELRDVFPTFVHASGHPLPKSVDGNSLLLLLSNSTTSDGSQWREWIDLEHDICYNVTNHWNALTDGKVKYIFNAYWASEQLFNLTADPMEMHDLVDDSASQGTLLLWRKRLVSQFEEEGRGPDWVKDGKLMQRIKGQLYSPNYPKKNLYQQWLRHEKLPSP